MYDPKEASHVLDNCQVLVGCKISSIYAKKNGHLEATGINLRKLEFMAV